MNRFAGKRLHMGCGESLATDQLRANRKKPEDGKCRQSRSKRSSANDKRGRQR